MASKRKKDNYLGAAQEGSVILNLVNLVDQSAVGGKTLSESCSQLRQTRSGSRSAVSSGHRKHRHGHCIEKHQHKAEHIQSDPCSCILEPSRFHKRELDISKKKPLLDYYCNVPQTRQGSKRERKVIYSCCRKTSKKIYSSTANSVKQYKTGTGTFVNKTLTTYPNRNRTQCMIRTLPYEKRSVYAMNLQVQQRRKKEYKLEPYECEPGVCIPGKCDPIECQKRILKRLMRKASTMTSTDKRSHSTSSETSPLHPELRSKQQQMSSRKHAAKPKVTFKRDGHQYETLPRKQGVRVGSNFNFSIEFSKSVSDGYSGRKGGTGINCECIDSYRGRHSGTGTDGRFKRKGTQDNMARNQDKGLQSSTGIHHKGSYITSKYKRCFCTLKLQKGGKQQNAIDFRMAAPSDVIKPIKIKQEKLKKEKNNKGKHKPMDAKMVSYGTETPGFEMNLVKDAYNTTKPYKLEPYECEPGVCTPGRCDPYECQKLIKKRLLRESGASTQTYKKKSTTGTRARKGKKLRDQNVQKIEKPGRPSINRYQGMRNVESSNYSIDRKLVDHDRQVVRIGSNFSFSMEFFKDKSPSHNGGNVHKVHSAVSDSIDTGNGQEMKKKERGVAGYQTRLVDRHSQQVKKNTNSKGTGVGSLLKRCFCTLKLQKSGKQQQEIKDKKDKKNKNRNTKKDISVATTREGKEYEPTLYIDSATKTRKMYPHLEPYECEPGTCVPGYCDPRECYERIKQRHLKTSGTGTKVYPRRSVGMLTDQGRPHMRKLQTDNIDRTLVRKTQQSYDPIVRVTRPSAVSPKNRQIVKIGSKMSFDIEFSKKSNSSNIMPEKKRYIEGGDDSLQTLSLHDKYGNTNILHKKGISQKNTDTHWQSTDSEVQSNLQTNNKASAAGKALKRCFCTAKLHHLGTGPMKKRVVTVGRIDKIQSRSPFKPTKNCEPREMEIEPCKCARSKQIKTKSNKLNETCLDKNKTQQTNTKPLKVKSKKVNSDDVINKLVQGTPETDSNVGESEIILKLKRFLTACTKKHTEKIKHIHGMSASESTFVSCGREREPCKYSADKSTTLDEKSIVKKKHQRNNTKTKALSKSTKDSKLDKKSLGEKKPQRKYTKPPMVKIGKVKSVNVKNKAADKNTASKKAIIMLHKKGKQEKTVKIQKPRKDIKSTLSCVPCGLKRGPCNCIKDVKVKESKLKTESSDKQKTHKNYIKPPKVKNKKVFVDDFSKKSQPNATEIDSNAVLSEVKLKLKHFFSACAKRCEIQPYTVVEISGDKLSKNISRIDDQHLGKETTIVRVGGGDIECKVNQDSKHVAEDKKQNKKEDHIKYKCYETCSYCKNKNKSKKFTLSQIKQILSECLLPSQIKAEYAKIKGKGPKLYEQYLDKTVSQQNLTKLMKMKKADKTKNIKDKGPKVNEKYLEKNMSKQSQIKLPKMEKPDKTIEIYRSNVDKQVLNGFVNEKCPCDVRKLVKTNAKSRKLTEKDFKKDILQQSQTTLRKMRKPDKGKAVDTKLVPNSIDLNKCNAVKTGVKNKLMYILNLLRPKINPCTVVKISGDLLTKYISAPNSEILKEETTVLMVGGADINCQISQDKSNEMETILPYKSKKFKKGMSKTSLTSRKANTEPIDSHNKGEPQEANKIKLTPKPNNVSITKQGTHKKQNKTEEPFSEDKNKYSSLQSGDAGLNLLSVKALKDSLFAKSCLNKPVEYTIAEVHGNKLVKNVCFSNDPTETKAVILTGTDLRCKISKDYRPNQGKSFKKRQQHIKERKTKKDKKRNPCVCGNVICAKVSKKSKVEPTQKTKKVKVKPCVCGSAVCKRVVATRDRLDNIRSQFDPRKSRKPVRVSKEQKKLDKKKKKMKKIEDARYNKGLKKRQKSYKKEDENRVKQRIKRDMAKFKQVKKYSKTSDARLLADSLFDISKLACTSVKDVTRAVYRAAIDPKHSYQSLKILATDPKRACNMCQRSLKESGVGSTFQRVKMRLSSMKCYKSAKQNLNQYPATSYLMHMADKDPKKRMKLIKKRQKKKKKIRKREPLDFQCSLYMASLRKRPWLSVYYMCPWFYPHCLSLLNVWKQLSDIAMFLLAIIVWSPCILMMEACRALLCCTVCTG